MLTDVLVALADPAPRDLARIASDLGTTPDRLRIALEQCERMGYLDRGDDGCSASACGSCLVRCGVVMPQGPGGPLPMAPSWWRLTERGRRAVAMAGRGA